MNKVTRWYVKEMFHLIPIVIYFAVCFNLLHFAQGLIMQPEDIRFTSYLGATLGAIIAGKAILVAEWLPFINAFPNNPIMYNITWKFIIYGIVFLLVQIFDYLAQGLYHTGNWALTYTNLKIDLSQSLFWGVQIFILIFCLIFIVFAEMMRVVGPVKIKKIFFG